MTAQAHRADDSRGRQGFLCAAERRFRFFALTGVRPKDRFGEVTHLFDCACGGTFATRRDIFRRGAAAFCTPACWSCEHGDCDDMTILLGAMLVATGHPSEARCWPASVRTGRTRTAHIYPEVNVARAMDRDRRDRTTIRMGWAPPAIWKRKVL